MPLPHQRSVGSLKRAQQAPRLSVVKPPNADAHADPAGHEPASPPPASRPVVVSTLLQPRVAVVLGVPAPWHRPLFACRLLSVAPALWFGLPPALRLIFRLYAALHLGLSPACDAVAPEHPLNYGLTENFLAITWCGASSYLSFFFTDCLMSRWLLNYTPQATIVRLLAVNALNGYLTSWVLYLAGGSEDTRLLLPAWIAIATILTAIYHTTQRKINIHKETSISISVFSIASFTSMLCLLAQLYLGRAADYPTIPLISLANRAWTLGVQVLDVLDAENRA
ncbi:hypothetical protein GGTG_00996 [Gaeumannomyces tritici R3-111a-1]|uniref:N-glycosylation protein EOS1 n=1 Tax=Gaeumannomyces tritici (strain R3-111a-1) TaxID=644352 RepID=J3NIB3_GAET3|nr:hypothetical protein GGTG_00996 [Gaeumannomyces tritici R3-111a-1]EJT81006.1 hypothetical protein GGTG_00996 [Gaeumannomyces tritici R3-111a-1]